MKTVINNGAISVATFGSGDSLRLVIESADVSYECVSIKDLLQMNPSLQKHATLLNGDGPAITTIDCAQISRETCSHDFAKVLQCAGISHATKITVSWRMAVEDCLLHSYSIDILVPEGNQKAAFLFLRGTVQLREDARKDVHSWPTQTLSVDSISMCTGSVSMRRVPEAVKVFQVETPRIDYRFWSAFQCAAGIFIIAYVFPAYITANAYILLPIAICLAAVKRLYFWNMDFVRDDAHIAVTANSRAVFANGWNAWSFCGTILHGKLPIHTEILH